jgi:hypothetical protein
MRIFETIYSVKVGFAKRPEEDHKEEAKVVF